MKRFVLILLATILFGGLRAQDSLRIVSQQPQMEDVLRLFEMNKIFINRFDLQSLLKTPYKVTFYVDEYKYAQKEQRLFNFMFGPNIGSVKVYPESQWDEARRAYGLAPDEDEYTRIKTATLIFRVVDDSLAHIAVTSPEIGMMSHIFRLYPVVPEEGEPFYSYSTRPFRLNGVADADTVEIPLVFYGSVWYDKKYKVSRFCGEKEIDPLLHAEIVGKVPHSYVVGMRLEKVKDEETEE